MKSLSPTKSDITFAMSGWISRQQLSMAILFKHARAVVEFNQVFNSRRQLKLRSAVAELAGTTGSKFANFTISGNNMLLAAYQSAPILVSTESRIAACPFGLRSLHHVQF